MLVFTIITFVLKALSVFDLFDSPGVTTSVAHTIGINQKQHDSREPS